METTTTTTVTVRQTARTLKRTLLSCSTPGDPPRPRAVGGAATQLLAAAALQTGLLLEGRLELGDALSHSHRRGPGGRGGP